MLGKVDDIYNAGSSDIYVVKDELGKQILLPAIKDVLKEADEKGVKILAYDSIVNIDNIKLNKPVNV